MPALHTQPKGERELSGGREEGASSVQDGSDGEQRQPAPLKDHTRGGWINLGDGFISTHIYKTLRYVLEMEHQ